MISLCCIYCETLWNRDGLICISKTSISRTVEPSCEFCIRRTWIVWRKLQVTPFGRLSTKWRSFAVNLSTGSNWCPLTVGTCKMMTCSQMCSWQTKKEMCRRGTGINADDCCCRSSLDLMRFDSKGCWCQLGVRSLRLAAAWLSNAIVGSGWFPHCTQRGNRFSAA